jgi:two-component system OmpR family sensor kinase
MTRIIGRWRSLAGWTLRTRLLAALIALLAAVSIVIGLVSVFALNSFMVDRLDQQLADAGRRAHNAQPPHAPSTPDDDKPGGAGLVAPGQGAGTLNAQLTKSTMQAGVLDSSGTPQSLSAAQQAALRQLPVDGRPHTVDLGGDLGSYRLVATTMPGGTVGVTGLSLQDAQATVYRLAGVVAGVSAAGLLAAALAGTVIVRLTLRPLRRVAATAGRVTELPLDRGEVVLAVRVPEADTDPRTEVGRVGAALNRLLGHVTAALTARQASETRVRQFVADASHELRTPLASIRGYAELARRSPDPVPPDVANALARVESEAVRMTGLVGDMLLLARLDAGRPARRQPVDLSSLLVDAVSDAHAAGPGHRWRLDLPDEPVTVLGDPAELHQVVANLLANARTHTPRGTAVTVTLRAAAGAGPASAADPPGGAVLTVADDGPGIAAELLPDVFERFARGDASRSRAAGSTGLGLAIVAAVVQAHHGQVEVTSGPGCTAFIVRLPAGTATA